MSKPMTDEALAELREHITQSEESGHWLIAAGATIKALRAELDRVERERDRLRAAFPVTADPEREIIPEEVLNSAGFRAVWSVIRGWDIGRDGGIAGYAGATGTDAARIVNAIAAELGNGEVAE